MVVIGLLDESAICVTVSGIQNKDRLNAEEGGMK